MATLGTLTLKLRATRKQLALDLLQSKQEIEQWQQSATKSLSLKAGLAIDWDSFSKAESEIRRWVDNLPSADLQIKAKFLSTDLQDNLQDLQRLLNNPLNIQVDDKRLFELNDHFKLKERDYQHLQSILTSPLSIKVDRTQLDNLSRDLRSIENTPQVNLRANVDLDSLRTFHEQLNRYTQGRTLELATSVSRTTLNALQNDLKALSSNLTTARVSVEIDSQLQALRSELGNLPNVSVGVSIDDSALGEFDHRIGRRQPGLLILALDFDQKTLSESVQKSVEKGFKSVKSSGLTLGETVTSIPKTIVRGFYEGIGQTYAKQLTSGTIKGIEEQFGASLDRVGNSIGERAANAGKAVGSGIIKRAGFGDHEQFKSKIGDLNEAFADLLPTDILERKLRKIENKLFKIVDDISRARPINEQVKNATDLGGAIAELREVPAQGIKQRRAKQVRKYAEQVKNSGSGDSVDIGEEAHTIVVATGGFAGMGGKSSEMVGKKLQTLLGNGYHVATVNNTATDVSLPIQKAGVGRWLAEGGAKIATHNMVDGINPDAVKMATLAHQLQQQYPGKKIKFAGYSAGGFAAHDATELYNATGKQSEGLAIGTPIWGINSRLKDSQFTGVLRELDGVNKVANQIESVTGIGLDKGKIKMTPGKDHDLSVYLADPKSQRVILDRLGGAHEPIRQDMTTPEAFKVVNHKADAQDLLTGLEYQLTNPLRDANANKALLNQKLAGIKEVRGAIKKSFPELNSMQGELTEYLNALDEAEDLIQLILKTGVIPVLVANPKSISTTDTKVSAEPVQAEYDPFKDSAKGLQQKVNRRKLRELAPNLDFWNNSSTELPDRSVFETPRRTTPDHTKFDQAVDKFAAAVDRFGTADPWIDGEHVETSPALPPSTNKLIGLPARLALGAGKGLLSEASKPLGEIYGAMQGTEAFALDLLPGGQTAKRIIKGAVLPSLMGMTMMHNPAIGAAVGTTGTALHSLAQVPIDQFAGMSGDTIRQLLANSIGHIPGSANAIGSISSQISQLVSSGGGAVTGTVGSLLAPFIVGRMGQNGLGKATNQLLPHLNAPAQIAASTQRLLLSAAPQTPFLAEFAAPQQTLVGGLKQMLLNPGKTMRDSVGHTDAINVPYQVIKDRPQSSALQHFPGTYSTVTPSDRQIDRATKAAETSFNSSISELKGLLHQPHELRNKAGELSEKFNQARATVKDILSNTSDPNRIEKAAALGDTITKSGNYATDEIATLTLQAKEIAADKSLSNRDRQVYQNAIKKLSSAQTNIKSKPKLVEKHFDELVTESDIQTEFADRPLISQIGKNKGLSGIAQLLLDRRNNSEGGYTLNGGILGQLATGYKRFAQSSLGQTRIPGLDFLDHPLKSFQETIGLNHRASDYTQGIMLGGDGTAQYTPPPTKLQSLISNTRERFITPTKQYIQEYPTNAKANFQPIADATQGLIDRLKDIWENSRGKDYLDRTKAFTNRPDISGVIQSFKENPIETIRAGMILAESQARKAIPTIQDRAKDIWENSRGKDYLDRTKAFTNRPDISGVIQSFKENPIETIRAGMILAESQARKAIPTIQDRAKDIWENSRGKDYLDRAKTFINRPNTPNKNPTEQPESLLEQVKTNASKLLINTRNTYDNTIASVKSGFDRLKGSRAPLHEDANALDTLATAAKNVIKGFAAFTGIAFVGGILTKIGAQAITAAANFQDLKLAVGAATSSQISANTLINRSTTQANQLGYNYQSAIASDASFAAATKGTPLELVSGNISTSLRQYNRVLGVSEERQKLSQTAVQQMAGKGTLAAEEVFGQLAESSPGAVNVLARSQGLTIGQLRARMQEGGLNSADTLSKFGMQLDAESINSVDTASRSTSATIGKVQNSILSLQTSVGSQLLAPATAGLNTFNDAIKLTESNIDSIAKLTIANFATLGTGALMLAAKLLSFKAGFDTIRAGFAALGPHLLKFGLQTAAVYIALETLSGIWGSFQNTSPMKAIADDMDAMLDKIKKNAGEAGKSLAELRSEKFSKNLSAFEQVGDFFNTGLRAVGAKTTLNSERRADEDTLTTDKVLTTTQAIIDRPNPNIAATRNEREALALELTILRARRANLTSRDREELQSNSTREQIIIKRQAELDKPITTRQAELEAAIKANRSILDDPAQTPSAQASAAQKIAKAEADQRNLQAELSRSSDKVSDLVIGLRKLTFESSAALKAIDQNAQLKSTQNYQAAALDPRNIGALQGTQAQDEIKDTTARRNIKQSDVNFLRGKLAEKSNILTQLEIDPDTTSKEKLEFLKNSKPDTLSQEIIAYAQQYQQAKQELLDSNTNLAKTQYNYLKSIVDYNKGLTDQIITLQTRITNLSLTARGSIASLQNQIDQTLIEIDTTATKALFQSQRNSIQTAYNKFLEKLGISTNDIFEQIFQNFTAINDSIEQIAQRKIGRKQTQNTQTQRQNANELKKDQITTEQQQSITELRRQDNERQNSNPLNQLPPNPNQPTDLIPPVKGTITSPYGNRTHPVHGGIRHHNGIDYGVPVGTPIKAAGEGIATFAGTKGGYGYTVQIRHPDGRSTLYAHQSKIGVKVHQQVSQGQIIGLSGGAKGHPGSGTSTGPHLHFEARNAQGEPIYPRTALENPLLGGAIESPDSVGVGKSPQPQPKPKPKPIPTGQIFNTAPVTKTPASTEVYGPVYKPQAADNTLQGIANRSINWIFGRNQQPLKSQQFKAPIPTQNTLDVPTKAEWDRMLATPLPPRLPAPFKQPKNPLLGGAIESPDSIGVGRSQSPYTNITSSFYTPGEGGAINGGKTDIRGKYIDRHSFVMATRTTASPQGIPYGATVELRNPANGNTTIVRNVDRGTLRPGRDIDLTPAPAAKLGITPDGVAKLQMRVISVPQGQPKPAYDLGGGIGSYDKKGNYTGKSGTIVRTQPTATEQIQNQTSPAAGQQIGQAILANAQQQSVDTSIDKTTAVSNKYVRDTTKLLDRDTTLSKQKLSEDKNLANQQNTSDYTKIDTQLIKNSNLIDRELPKYNRETTQLIRTAAAKTRSQDRSPYQQTDKIHQQYGGIRDTSILDPTITDAQTTIDRIKEESRANRENLNNRIRKIQSDAIAVTELTKTQTPIIAKLRKQGNNAAADRAQTILDTARRAAGTPQLQQQTISSITKQRDALPSDAIAVYNQIAPGTSKALTATQSLFEQYLPKDFNSKLQIEARSIAERFKAIRELIQSELEKLNLNIKDIETEIQAKFKAKGYAPQKLDLTDPKKLATMRTIAPTQTAALEQATAKRLALNLSAQNIDRNAETATTRSERIGKQREQLTIDRVNTDYLATTQDSSVFAIAQVNNQRYTQGKTELDLQQETGAISPELYTANLNRLTLETNTFRNALLSLKPAAKGFFDEIFTGDRVFESFGSALRNLTINILKHFQDIISKQLGEQLFNSLMPTQQDQKQTAGKNKDILTDTITKITEGVSLGITPTNPQSLPSPKLESTPSFTFDHLRKSFSDAKTQPPFNLAPPPPIDLLPTEVYGPQQQTPSPQTTSIGSALLSALPSIALSLLNIPGFATGGLVTSPTLALVGEGIHNEAIVPLPNGRSIPVDLKGAGESSGNGNISNAISVTIQNSGQAQQTSRGDASAIANIIQNLVTQEMINQRRPGGLLA